MLKRIKSDVDCFGSISNKDNIKGNNKNIYDILNLRYQKDEIERFKEEECVLQ